MMLVVNLSSPDAEKELLEQVKEYSRICKIKSRNISKGKMDLVMEVRTRKEADMAGAVSALSGVEAVALISHDGEVTF